MAIKKQHFEDDEELICDDAVIYKRGNYWHFRMWLTKERKYARFSLKTQNKSTAIDSAKKHYYELKALEYAGKTYYSKTCKHGVEAYLEQRQKDVEAGVIVKGRLSTIQTHLEHWLDFIGRDTKLKELQRIDCENYYYSRTKTKKKLSVSQTTVENEQSTINAMLNWLYKRDEVYISAFDFKKLKRVDKGLYTNRRATFTDNEVRALTKTLQEYIAEAEKDLSDDKNFVKALAGYYMGVALITGLRRGEQLKLRWCDVEDIEHKAARDKGVDVITITVRGETSKVRKTRRLAVKDTKYFSGLIRLAKKRHKELKREYDIWKAAAENEELIFSVDGKKELTARAIHYHFYKLLELAGIENNGERDLVPYSFRHYFITQRVNSNIPIAAIAEMCGTSITQIEKTYYHTTLEKMVSNALKGYTVRNGLFVLNDD